MIEKHNNITGSLRNIQVCSLPTGSRGLLREIWTSTVKNTLSDIASLDSSAADYHVEYLTESSSPEVVSFNRTSGYSSKITGFYVPSQDDVYRFGIQSDDASELYLSLTGDPANKVFIAYRSFLYRPLRS